MFYAQLITACFLRATFLLFLCLVEVLVAVVVIEKYCASSWLLLTPKRVESLIFSF